MDGINRVGQWAGLGEDLGRVERAVGVLCEDEIGGFEQGGGQGDGRFFFGRRWLFGRLRGRGGGPGGGRHGGRVRLFRQVDELLEFGF